MLLTRRSAKRHVIIAALTLSACAALPGAASAHFGSNSYDRVVGVGTNNPADPTKNINGFLIDVRSGPLGEDPSGVAGFAGPIPNITSYNAGRIQCLRVAGNVATMVYKIQWQKKLPGNMSTRDAVVIFVQDNGYPTKVTKPVDRVANTLFDSTLFPELLNCPDPASPEVAARLAATPILSTGDTVVKDAS
jgi:hypothetical protein